MKYILILLLFQTVVLECFAQKPPLDFSAAKSWPEISNESISNDGRYIAYTISSENAGSSLFVQSTDGKSKREFHGAGDLRKFSEDSRSIIFQKTGDTLCILQLDNWGQLNIPNVASYQLPKNGNGEFLAYAPKDHGLVLMDLVSGKKKFFPEAGDYWFSPRGKALLLQTSGGQLDWFDPLSGVQRCIWRGKHIEKLAFNKNGLELAFITHEKTLGYYQAGSDSARSLDPGPNLDLLTSELRFSPDGSKLFFDVAGMKVIDAKSPADVWSYLDDFIAPRRLQQEPNRSISAVFNFREAKVVLLTPPIASYLQFSNDTDSRYALFVTRVNGAASYRKAADWPEVYIENTDDGSLRRITKLPAYVFPAPSFSAGGKYVLWYNSKEKAYFTYEIRTGRVRNISSKMPEPLFDVHWDRACLPEAYAFAGWLQQDKGLLVYDHYDIWLLDPEGIKSPVNITGGYGRKNRIRLRYVYNDGTNFYSANAIDPNATLLLCGFDERNKNNGFFRESLTSYSNPEKLIMAPQLFYFPEQLEVGGMPDVMLKATKANTYLLTCMSAGSYPNLVLTTDFRHFSPMTSLEPQKQFNWLTAELFRWKPYSADMADGIIYKPGDFDPHKKYPVIFYLYERFSPALNKYLVPNLSSDRINIPWFVSNGYIVVCPDIRYKVGEPGRSIYNYVVSAADRLAREPWVDKGHMGIQGHSWGGYEVNILLTETKRFAAASSAAGDADLVSEAATDLNKGDGFGFVEQETYRMGVNLWQNPVVYIKNSPIYKADKVMTPLLIMHNKDDGNVPYSQGIEMYTALRRLDKKVWLLQYDGETHVLENPVNQLDYSIRLGQFFDHYLKGKPAPDWMK